MATNQSPSGFLLRRAGLGSGLSLSGIVHQELSRSGELVRKQSRWRGSLHQKLRGQDRASSPPRHHPISSGGAGSGAVCHRGGGQADKAQEGYHQ